jgi:hypothetical protein
MPAIYHTLLAGAAAKSSTTKRNTSSRHLSTKALSALSDAAMKVAEQRRLSLLYPVGKVPNITKPVKPAKAKQSKSTRRAFPLEVTQWSGVHLHYANIHIVNAMPSANSAPPLQRFLHPSMDYGHDDLFLQIDEVLTELPEEHDYITLSIHALSLSDTLLELNIRSLFPDIDMRNVNNHEWYAEFYFLQYFVLSYFPVLTQSLDVH